MHLLNSSFIYSATDVSNFLACRRLTALDRAAALGGPKPPVFDDPGAEVLRERGLQHEEAILEGYREQGSTSGSRPSR